MQGHRSPSAATSVSVRGRSLTPSATTAITPLGYAAFASRSGKPQAAPQAAPHRPAMAVTLAIFRRVQLPCRWGSPSPHPGPKQHTIARLPALDSLRPKTPLPACAWLLLKRTYQRRRATVTAAPRLPLAVNWPNIPRGPYLDCFSSRGVREAIPTSPPAALLGPSWIEYRISWPSRSPWAWFLLLAARPAAETYIPVEA